MEITRIKLIILKMRNCNISISYLMEKHGNMLSKRDSDGITPSAVNFTVFPGCFKCLRTWNNLYYICIRKRNDSGCV